MDSSGRFEPGDEVFRGSAEDVVVGHLAALLRLDPLRPKAVQPPPLLELRAQADHVEEWLLAREAADRRPVIGVEVAMHSDSARLGEGDRLLYLTAGKVLFAHPCRWDGKRTRGRGAARARAPRGRRPPQTWPAPPPTAPPP